MENTKFQNSTYLSGIWIETPNSSGTNQVHRTLGGSRKVGYASVDLTGKSYGSTRPVIELPITKVSTKMLDLSEEYTVTFNANGGNGSMEQLTCETFIKCELSRNSFTKDGYIFVGWSTTPNGEIEFENGEEVYNIVMSGNIDLYAVWDDGLYNVVKESYNKK